MSGSTTHPSRKPCCSTEAPCVRHRARVPCVGCALLTTLCARGRCDTVDASSGTVAADATPDALIADVTSGAADAVPPTAAPPTAAPPTAVATTVALAPPATPHPAEWSFSVPPKLTSKPALPVVAGQLVEIELSIQHRRTFGKQLAFIVGDPFGPPVRIGQDGARGDPVDELYVRQVRACHAPSLARVLAALDNTDGAEDIDGTPNLHALHERFISSTLNPQVVLDRSYLEPSLEIDLTMYVSRKVRATPTCCSHVAGVHVGHRLHS